MAATLLLLAACGGGSGTADSQVTPATGDRVGAAATSARILQADTAPVNMADAPSGTGLTGNYYYKSDFTGDTVTRVDAEINFDWVTAEPVPNTGDRFAVRWSGQIEPEFSETYTIYTQSDDGIRVWVNGEKVVENWTAHPSTENSGSITLVAGQKYDIAVEYFDSGGHAVAKLSWSSASRAKQIIPQARLYAVAGSDPAPLPTPTPAPTPTSTPAPVSNDKTGPRAMQAAKFIDTIGVNAHFDRIADGNTIWAKQKEVIRTKLLESGIPHIRTAQTTALSSTGSYIDYLASMDGVRINMLTDWDQNLSLLPSVGAVLGNKLATLESRNEPDLRWSSDSAQRLRQLQKNMFDVRNGNASLSNVKLLGPSVLNRWAAVEVGDMSSYVDYLNPHMYTGTAAPEEIYSDWGSDGNGYGSVKAAKEMHAIMGGDKCLTPTEAGEHNAYTNDYGHLGLTEKIAGRVIPRVYLELARRGICRTFIYELVDEWNDSQNVEASFGMLRNDMSEKPSFKAVKSMISLLRDPANNSMNFAAGQLDYSVTGNIANVTQILFQKADGTFYVALWLGKRAWDWKNRVEVPINSQNVTLNVPTRQTARIHSFDDAGVLNSGSMSSIAGGKIDLTLSDRVTFVELK